MSETNLICGCGGEIGYDCNFKLSKFGIKGHFKFYCRKNCGLNFNFTKFFRVQLPEKTETVPDYIVKLFTGAAIESIKKAIRYQEQNGPNNLETTTTNSGKTYIWNLKGE